MRPARGFTLIELLVVFAIGAVLLSLAPVAFDRLKESSDYRDTVRSITSQLRAARATAQAEGREVRFLVSLQDRSYRTDQGRPWVVPEPLQLRATVAGTETNGRDAAIRFLPSGGATGGSIEVLRPAGGGTRLRVDWLSGKVSLEPLLP